MFDLPSYTAQRLIKAGIQHIGQSPFDTCKEETLFFSHRRTTLRGEKGRGSLLSAIAITQ
jgi:copper oxidase (laccase) domain-containing protein